MSAGHDDGGAERFTRDPAGLGPDAEDAAVRAVEHRLRNAGVPCALEFLNARTRFRYTGLYRLVPPRLHNVALFDRENPAVAMAGVVCEMRETYCALTSAGNVPFQVTDAPNDARLVEHPARLAVQSYGGVPVRDVDGRVLGTLCHFDGRPRLLPAGELELLERVAPSFAGWLLSPAPVDPRPSS